MKRGSVEVLARLTGNTTARVFGNVTAPKLMGPEGDRELILLTMLPSGRMVKKDDLIAEIDPQSLLDHIDDVKDRVQNRKNDVDKKLVQQELDRERLEQQLRVARATLDKARLDLKTGEVRTAIDREVMRLSAEEADAAYKELQSEIAYQKESQAADLRVTQIEYKKELDHVNRHTKDLERFKLRSPIDGMVVVMTNRRPGGDQVAFAVGDRVNPGTTFIRVIDTRNMQLEATINQAESQMFRLGQRASVKLDAFPQARYAGVVDSIGALAVNPGRSQFFIRSIPVRLKFLELDQRVIPDLTGAGDVVLDREENVLVAPADAINEENGQTFVTVKTPNGSEKRSVKVGLNNGVEVEIEEGLREGEQILVNSGGSELR